MEKGFLIQFAVSLAAVAGLVALSAWARIARPTPPLDEGRARALLAEEYPDRTLDRVWVASDGLGALAKSGPSALVIWSAGDGYVARDIPWLGVLKAPASDGRLILDLEDFAAPRATLSLAGWPPGDAAA